MPESGLTADDIQQAERYMGLCIDELVSRCNHDFRWGQLTELTARREHRRTETSKIRFWVEASEGPGYKRGARRVRLILRDRTQKPGSSYELSREYGSCEKLSRVTLQCHCNAMHSDLAKGIRRECLLLH